MLPLRIINQQFQLLGEIDGYTSLQFTQSHYGVGTLEMRVNRYQQNVDELKKDRIVFVGNQVDKAYKILYREIELDGKGKATENWIIKGCQLKSIAFQRVVLPTAGQVHNSVTARTSEVMKHYVNTELINPLDANRRYDGVTIGTTPETGEVQTVNARYDVLGELLSTIGVIEGIGWDITLDIENKFFVFVTKAGSDRSVDQEEHPPVIFSTDYGTLKNMKFVDSSIDYKNVAIVAGQGEGINRQIVIVDTNGASGAARHEVFIDARDVPNETDGEDPKPRPPEKIKDDLRKRAHEKLKLHEQTFFCEGQALDNGFLSYGKDYYLGDIVTIQNKEWGVTINARITEVKEVIERNRRSREFVFDNDRPTLITKIKDELSVIKNEIKK